MNRANSTVGLCTGLSGLFFLVGCGESLPGKDSAPGGTPKIPAPRASETLSGSELVKYTEEREPCDDRNPLRNAYFGDLHIHTSYSYDARPLGIKTTPADAYNFANGGEISMPPYDENNRPAAILKIDRPLDFAAVTDHAEFLGETTLCTDAASSAYDSESCQTFRKGGVGGVLVFVRGLSKPKPERDPDVCGKDGAQCVDESITLWKRTRDMAENAYDRSSNCQFTSFIGYEHTGTPNSNNYHRNVIFRNERVPARPVSYFETPSDKDLWNRLTKECLNGLAGCDVLAIPHNSNLSSGSMFPSYVAGSESDEAAKFLAATRNALEPVIEVFQHKGNSECFNGLPDILGEPDELCDVEQLRQWGRKKTIAGEPRPILFCEEGEVGKGGMINVGCVSSNDFFRSVLLTGLQNEKKIGVNPYKFGAIGSTDTHVSTPGAVAGTSRPGIGAPA